MMTRHPLMLTPLRAKGAAGGEARSDDNGVKKEVGCKRETNDFVLETLLVQVVIG